MILDGLSCPYYYWSQFNFFAFQMRRISVVRSLYFEIILASFLITFMTPEIAMPVNRHVPFS